MTYAIRSALAAVLLVPVLSAGAAAQAPQSATPGQATEGAAPKPPAVEPANQNSGTAPQGAGSTGWTGGTGGSFVGTSNQGPTDKGGTDHPETTQGLDPLKNEKSK